MPSQPPKKPSAQAAAALTVAAMLGLSASSPASPALAQPQSEAPRVLVTVAPIHSLAAAVMEGVGAPELLIKGAFSEHTYALKPSDARKLSEAQVIVRVAPNLESFLDKSLESLPKAARVINLNAEPGMVQWPIRTGGYFEPHAHEKEDEHDGGDEHGHKAHDELPDPHIWLDPRNAALIAEKLSATLTEIDPAHAEQYRLNVKALKARLTALDDELHTELSPLRGKPYIVFHDAYQYFEKRYGLSPAGSISLSSAQAPGARHMNELRQKIQHLEAVCVFTEPQFDSKLAQTLIAGTSAKTATLDGVGANLAPGPDLYFKLERQLAQNLKSCVGGQ